MSADSTHYSRYFFSQPFLHSHHPCSSPSPIQFLTSSHSEDEDAPSPLTRRLSALNLSRRSSATSISTSHSHSSPRSPHPLSRSISHSVLREEEGEDDLAADEFGHIAWSSLSASGSKSRHISGSRSLPLNGRTSKARANKDDTNDGVRPQDEFARDGVTPTRTVFRDSDGSSSSGVGTGRGHASSGARRTHSHTPSSTASTSSLSLPFPATPESPNPLSSVQNSNPCPLSPIPSRATTPSICNVDKSLPPLPLTPRKYPPSLSRMRTYSCTSSVGSGDLGSTNVVPGGAGDGIAAGTSTPKPSLGGVPRPSLGGVPRPSLNTPRPSLGGVPRPSLSTPRPSISTRPPDLISPHPSMSNSSLSTPNPSLSSLAAQNGHGNGSVSFVPFVSSHSSSGPPSPMPRLLKLLQPGEQPPRPGGVLMYNRNVHDHLKRTQSQPLSSVSMTQTLVMPGEKPKPRTGTGMVYRSSSGPVTSRMRVPSAVRPSGVGVAL